MNNDPKLSLLLSLLDDLLENFEEYSVTNNDIFSEELAEIRLQAESMRDQGWKVWN